MSRWARVPTEKKSEGYWHGLTFTSNVWQHAMELVQLSREMVGRQHLPLSPQVSDLAESSTYTKQTTVGLTYDDKLGVIQSVVIGGPAWTSKQVFGGDTIISVDGVRVDPAAILDKLTGTDLPGSLVELGLRRAGGNEEVVQLRRMSNAAIADKRYRRVK